MLRRTFFKSFGAAILGTALILKIPEILIPYRPILPDVNPNEVITWSMLNKAFNDIKSRNLEPNIIMIPKWAIPYLESL
jgi:hypothetical protein